MLVLVVTLVLLHGLEPPPDPGRGLPLCPFVVKESENRYRGLTLDLISALNEVQQEVRFVFVPTSATYRYQALALGRFSLMLFEDIRWNWDAGQVHMTPPLLLGAKYMSLSRCPA